MSSKTYFFSILIKITSNYTGLQEWWTACLYHQTGARRKEQASILICMNLSNYYSIFIRVIYISWYSSIDSKAFSRNLEQYNKTTIFRWDNWISMIFSRESILLICMAMSKKKRKRNKCQVRQKIENLFDRAKILIGWCYKALKILLLCKKHTF